MLKQKLLESLKEEGRIDVYVKHSSSDHSESMIDHHYLIEGVDIILVEGIFLFQEQFTFDYRIWVECSFDTAFERALLRNQEGQTEDQLNEDYYNTYFPAQQIHFKKNDPKSRADFIILNDYRLE